MEDRTKIKKRKRRKGTVIRVTGVFFLLGAIGVWMAVSHYMSESEALDLSELEDPLPEPTEIYDANGEVITELQAHNFTSVQLSEIPEIMIEAVIAVEDERFYEHSGFDYRAIGRSAWRNIKAGGISEGGSTITQQLAKNLYFSAERTFDRKIREVFAANRIENEFDKDVIMELYLNQIYFGEGTWGVQDAAQKYFGKDIQDIELEEAALLAGLPRSPTFYSPFQNEEQSKERRNLVLSMMYDQGYIDENEFEEAVEEPIVLTEETEEGPGNNYPAYIEFVLDEAVRVHGLTEAEIYEEGMQIHTQMDPQVQQAIEDALENEELFPENEGEDIVQSASVVVDPETGGIKGLKGYRGEYVARGFNRASQLRRSPGSTIKPLSVFAPAMEEGFSPEDELEDEEMEFGDNEYTPTNNDNEFVGELTVREALVTSRNVPAVALLDEIGVEKGYEFLKQAKLPVEDDEKHNLSIALGGLTNGASPLEMAQAYTTFPNEGNMTEAFAITKITDRNGDVIVERETNEVEMMEPVNAYAVTDMLIDAVEDGTGFRAKIDGWEVAGKTGTAQLPDTEAFEDVDGVHDAWFVGYTPELVASVWIGYDNPGGDNVLDTFGGNHPAMVFQSIMEDSLEGISESAFDIPDGYEERIEVEDDEDDDDNGEDGNGEDGAHEDNDDNNDADEASPDNEENGGDSNESNDNDDNNDNSANSQDDAANNNNNNDDSSSEENTQDENSSSENNGSTDDNEGNSSNENSNEEDNSHNGSSNNGNNSGNNSNNNSDQNNNSENNNDTNNSGGDNNSANNENNSSDENNNSGNNNNGSSSDNNGNESSSNTDNNGNGNNEETTEGNNSGNEGNASGEVNGETDNNAANNNNGSGNSGSEETDTSADENDNSGEENNGNNSNNNYEANNNNNGGNSESNNNNN
ncbi:PBP1A family penicillin-binding protein [Evansella sp. LMS18]|jgi:penicillin-binding protein 2A|uniref:transglycosylase domain-containing protein n=1 Tax=Evansella sp. LMS18 TaxID=2924033 RepID=UPI0020D1C0F9|nr:PBP1A family penicillin-binding protein [Evansella sp. LMS18]UTR09838.1 PBP1A family penicillin-binding protein [Evansella sp. LMS18]